MRDFKWRKDGLAFKVVKNVGGCLQKQVREGTGGLLAENTPAGCSCRNDEGVLLPFYMVALS